MKKVSTRLCCGTATRMLNSKSQYLLLDVGGTFIKRSDGTQVHIHSSGSREEIAAALREAVGDVSAMKGVGVSIPGPFDYREGVFLMKHKYAAVYGGSFRSLAGIPEGVELRFMHDVNAPLLGALRSQGLQDAALVTIGTGLGFSYARGGEVQTSVSGSPARSIWNLPFGEGILEDAVSARGISASYTHISGEALLNAKAVSERARKGDETAAQAYLQAGSTLGAALKSVLGELGITVLLMGGQVCRSLDLMLPALAPELPGVSIQRLEDGAVFKGLATLFE